MSWGVLVGSVATLAGGVWFLKRDSDIALEIDARKDAVQTEHLFEEAVECRGDHITVYDETGSTIRTGRIYRVRKRVIVLDVRRSLTTVGDKVIFPMDKPGLQDLKNWVPKPGHNFHITAGGSGYGD